MGRFVPVWMCWLLYTNTVNDGCIHGERKREGSVCVCVRRRFGKCIAAADWKGRLRAAVGSSWTLWLTLCLGIILLGTNEGRAPSCRAAGPGCGAGWLGAGT